MASKQLTGEQRDKVEAYLMENDFSFWMQRRDLGGVQGMIHRYLGFDVSQAEIRRMADKNCIYFRQLRRKDPKIFELDSKGWLKLRKVVQRLRVHLHGRTLEEATAIVSGEMPVSSGVLDGLCSDMKVWESQHA